MLISIYPPLAPRNISVDFKQIFIHTSCVSKGNYRVSNEIKDQFICWIFGCPRTDLSLETENLMLYTWVDILAHN